MILVPPTLFTFFSFRLFDRKSLDRGRLNVIFSAYAISNPKKIRTGPIMLRLNNDKLPCICLNDR